MPNSMPNRVAIGKSGAGRYDFKRNTEATIDLEDADAYVNEDYQCENMHVLVKDYMDDIEANPSVEGMRSASRKYRSEIYRLEAELKAGEIGIDSYPDPESWNLDVEKYGIQRDEWEDDDFCHSRAVLELKAVDRINELRNQSLETQYAKYQGDFPDGPSEVEISINSDEADSVYSGTVMDQNLKPTMPYEDGRSTYVESMRRSIIQKLNSEGAAIPNDEVLKALIQVSSNKTSTAYLLRRSGLNRFDGNSQFTEVVVVPSQRETERVDLGTKAISEGWL